MLGPRCNGARRSLRAPHAPANYSVASAPSESLFDDQLVGVVEPHVDGAAVGLRHLDLPGGAVPRISLHGVRASTPRRLEGRGGGPIRLRAADLLGGVVLGLARLVRRLGISRTSAPGDWPVPWSRPEAAPAMADPPRPSAAKAATPIRTFFRCLVIVLPSSWSKQERRYDCVLRCR